MTRAHYLIARVSHASRCARGDCHHAHSLVCSASEFRLALFYVLRTEVPVSVCSVCHLCSVSPLRSALLCLVSASALPGLRLCSASCLCLCFRLCLISVSLSLVAPGLSTIGLLKPIREIIVALTQMSPANSCDSISVVWIYFYSVHFRLGARALALRTENE